MASANNQTAGDVIDAIRPDLEAFASLWSALRTNYQGTNITKTVARLLHMYQPNDGILAYERLLRTLYVLLEDFDPDGLRLLVSMVPPPNGAQEDTIKRVFKKATGFLRLEAPIFRRNSNNATGNSEENANLSSTVKSYDGISESSVSFAQTATPRLKTVRTDEGNSVEGTTILRAVVKADVTRKIGDKSPKIVQQEKSEVFRGFPSTEVTNTQSHARKMTKLYVPSTNYRGFPGIQTYANYRQLQNAQNDPSNAYKLKWFDASTMQQKNNSDTSTRKTNLDSSAGYPNLILKTADNKFIRLPIKKINGPPIGHYASSYNGGATVNATPLAYQRKEYYQNNHTNLKNNGSISFKGPSKNVSSLYSTINDAKTSVEDSQKDRQPNLRKEESLRLNSMQKTYPKFDLPDHDYGCTKFNGNYEDSKNLDAEMYRNENSKTPNNEAIERFENAVKIRQRAIQEDIYRMDVVRHDDEIVSSQTESFECVETNSLTVGEELKESIQNFLKRAETDSFFDPSPFRGTKILEESDNYHSSTSKPSSQIWKIESITNYQENYELAGGSSSQNSTDESTSPLPNEKIAEASSSSMEPKKKRIRTNLEKHTSSMKSKQLSRCDKSNATSEKINTAGKFKESLNHQRFAVSESESSTFNSIRQANSMMELVNYRKQYYDALLSIQRAKAAVANSLAISSTHTAAGYDPRTYYCLQQQHQVLQQQQQQQRYFVNPHGPQYPVPQQTIVQPMFSRTRDARGLWIRSNDWRYNNHEQYTYSRQPTSSVTSSTYNFQETFNQPTNENISTSNSFSATSLNFPQESQKSASNRRKLEDIVGQLKETENDA